MHHAICDGWSLGVFVEELVALYDAFSPKRDRRWRRCRFSTRTLRIGSELGGHIPRSLPTRILAKQLLRSVAIDAACGPQVRDGRSMISHRAARVGIADEAFGGRETLQPPTRRHGVHDARRCLENAAASLPGSGRRASGHERCQSQSLRRRKELIGPLANTVILRTNLAGDPTAREVMRRVRTTASWPSPIRTCL